MRRNRTLLCAVFALTLFVGVPSCFAHDYNRRDDHPLRIIAYPIHAIGVLLEQAIYRPIHWAVSQPDADVIFGHEASYDDEYWAWRVTP